VGPKTVARAFPFAVTAATQANSAFHPSGVGKCVVIQVLSWITRVAINKRQTRAAYGCWPQVWARGRGPSLQPIGSTPALFVT